MSTPSGSQTQTDAPLDAIRPIFTPLVQALEETPKNENKIRILRCRLEWTIRNDGLELTSAEAEVMDISSEYAPAGPPVGQRIAPNIDLPTMPVPGTSPLDGLGPRPERTTSQRAAASPGADANDMRREFPNGEGLVHVDYSTSEKLRVVNLHMAKAMITAPLHTALRGNHFSSSKLAVIGSSALEDEATNDSGSVYECVTENSIRTHDVQHILRRVTSHTHKNL